VLGEFLIQEFGHLMKPALKELGMGLGEIVQEDNKLYQFKALIRERNPETFERYDRAIVYVGMMEELREVLQKEERE
jgi:hypothetical protein